MCNLEYVQNGAEARRAKLSEKTAITELTLKFGSNLPVDKCKHHSDILEGLKPHSNLKGLILESYGGQNCPSWMLETAGNLRELTCLQNLFRMQFYDCPYLESIPSLALGSKAELDIRRCTSLRSISVSVLQNLILEDCNELVLVQFEPLALTSLKEMKIMCCRKLESLPMVSKLASLELLDLRECSSLQSIGESLLSCTCLRYLCLIGCEDLSFPNLRGLSSLQSIYI